MVAERQAGFQMFLDLLLEVPVAAWQQEVLKFFNAEDTVGGAFRGLGSFCWLSNEAS